MVPKTLISIGNLDYCHNMVFIQSFWFVKQQTHHKMTAYICSVLSKIDSYVSEGLEKSADEGVEFAEEVSISLKQVRVELLSSKKVTSRKVDQKIVAGATAEEKVGSSSSSSVEEANPDHLAALLRNLATQPAATSLYRRMFKLSGNIATKDGLNYLTGE